MDIKKITSLVVLKASRWEVGEDEETKMDRSDCDEISFSCREMKIRHTVNVATSF